MSDREAALIVELLQRYGEAISVSLAPVEKLLSRVNTDEVLEVIQSVHDGAHSLGVIATEMRRLNDNLAAGSINLRTHHPQCTVPPNADWSILQLEAAAKFLNQSIETGAFILPAREGSKS